MSIEYTIKEEIAVLSESKNGWTKEINMVSWNGREASIDIRRWSADHEQMGKGISLNEDEALKLYRALKKYFGEETVSAYNDAGDTNIQDIFFGKKR